MQMHKTQTAILYSLRHTPSARFSELMKPTGLSSDVFKFHIRKLQNLGFLSKHDDGSYALTDDGKEFANDLDDKLGGRQRQPKLSVVVIAMRTNQYGEAQFLAQQRRRQPYFGYWSAIGGPVQWGERIEDAGSRELLKQTGLAAECVVCGFYRKQDFALSNDRLLEDKLFAVLKAENVRGNLNSEWRWGKNAWMSSKEFKSQSKFFESVCEMMAMLKPGDFYRTNQASYTLSEY